MIAILMAFAALATPPALAQTQEKAQIIVSNERNEPVVMQFAYAFRQYSWDLMRQEIPSDGELTYRFPVGLPGCEKLHEWGLADGLLTISNASGTLCAKRISLCDQTAVAMHVQMSQCVWNDPDAPRSTSGILIGR
jgi:hypothetical protein